MQTESRLKDASSLLGQARRAVLYLDKLFGFLDGARPLIRVALPHQARPAPAALAVGVTAEALRFRYPGGSEDVLRDVDLLLPVGRVAAIVGATGAGKTTLVKLLTRMHDPDAGRLAIDDVSIDEFDLEALRSRIAVVYQDFARFSLTLAENIEVGRVAVSGGTAAHGTAQAAELAREHVRAAARASGADEVAATLPRGYDTELTTRFQGGVDVSGGEWQRVAAARVCARRVARPAR